jgi:hypothetical protein
MVPGRSAVDRTGTVPVQNTASPNACAGHIVGALTRIRPAQALGDVPWDQFTTNPFALVGRPAITPRSCSAPAPVM